jgi:preprotein translocase subunit SecY
MRGAELSGGTTSHLPLKVNQACVIPIIFAVSLILIPTMVANMLAQSKFTSLASGALKVSAWLQDGWVYGVLFFTLVVVFTYFYTAVVFDPNKISENLQKQGGYIPGIRPGASTTKYLYHIINRITLAGSVFLGAVAVLPNIVQGITGIQALSLGGVSVLIVVSVVLELIKNVQGQMTMRSYESF